MQKKMGRPTTDPKTLNTRIRLSEEDVRKLEMCSQKLNTTKADVIRMGIELVYSQFIVN